MGGDLVQDGVGADDRADHLAAGAGGAGGGDLEVAVALRREVDQSLKELLGGGDRLAGGLAVDVANDAVVVVDQAELGAGRADVDAERGADGRARLPAAHPDLVACRVGVALFDREARVARAVERERFVRVLGAEDVSFVGAGGVAGVAGRVVEDVQAHPALGGSLVGEPGAPVDGRGGGAVLLADERRADGAEEVAVDVGQDRGVGELGEPVAHVAVQGNATQERGRAAERLAFEQGLQRGLGHAAAQAAPHLGL